MTAGTSKTPDGPSRWLTVPNALCLFRVLAAPFLVLLATRDRGLEAAVLFVLMAMSDWLDGKLAVLLDQRSRIGPTLDSVADLIMYGALIASVAVLDFAALSSRWVWLASGIVTYLVAGLASLIKFGRWPIHHTRMAKVSWFLVLTAAVLFLGVGSLWLLPIAMVGVVLANLQSLIITRWLPRWTTDVASITEARRLASHGRVREIAPATD